MTVTVETAKVYRASRAGRRYFSLTAAANAEARAIIKVKYPNEQAEYESGHLIYPGSDWTGLPRSEVLHRRLARLVRAGMTKAESSTLPEKN